MVKAVLQGDCLRAVLSSSFDPVFAAASAGNWAVLKWLLTDRAADIPSRSKRMFVAFTCAMEAGADDIARWLVEVAGLSPLARDDTSGTLMHSAVYCGRLAVARWLLEAGVDPLECDSSGGTVVHIAARGLYVALLRWLLDDVGCDPDMRDYSGLTPLHASARHRKSTRHIFILLATGRVNVNSVANCGTAIIHDAMRWHDTNMCSAIAMAPGCNVNARDAAGKTALHLVAGRPMVGDVRTLLKAGADPEIRDNAGQTAADIARRGPYKRIATYLTGPRAKRRRR